MELITTPDVTLPTRRALPLAFDPTDIPSLESAAARLLERPLATPADLDAYLLDWSELASLVAGAWARRGTASHRETANTEARDRLRQFQSETWPAWERLADQLNRRFLDSPHRTALGPERAVFLRRKEIQARIFREENTKLGAQEQAKVTDWEGVQGAISIPFEGKELTREQAGALLQDEDRGRRERVFRAVVERRARDRETIDGIYDAILELRGRISRNADYPNYVEYRFAQLQRFDYTPADCETFHSAVEEVVAPFCRELREERRRRLGVPTLRPYDLSVSLLGRGSAPLFRTEKELIGLASRHFERVDPRFEGDFDILVRNGLLDLMSRPGKAPGGYNWGVEDMRLPFIFANAVGSPRDLQVLLHEGGHAFHTIGARGHDLIEDRDAPTEFAEVASMGMELLAMEQMPHIFDAETARALAAENLESVLFSFGRIAQVDAFQHWLYRTPGHSADARRAKWVELGERFGPGVDWTGFEEAAADSWQAIMHFFSHPLYFIEYGLAQLGALQLWRNYLADPKRAVSQYRAALALGGTRPLPELFRTAGLRFAMDASIFREVVPPAVERLKALLN